MLTFQPTPISLFFQIASFCFLCCHFLSPSWLHFPTFLLLSFFSFIIDFRLKVEEKQSWPHGVEVTNWQTTVGSCEPKTFPLWSKDIFLWCSHVLLRWLLLIGLNWNRIKRTEERSFPHSGTKEGLSLFQWNFTYVSLLIIVPLALIKF